MRRQLAIAFTAKESKKPLHWPRSRAHQSRAIARPASKGKARAGRGKSMSRTISAKNSSTISSREKMLASPRVDSANDREKAARPAAASEPATSGIAHGGRVGGTQEGRGGSGSLRARGIRTAAPQEVAVAFVQARNDRDWLAKPLPYSSRRLREARLLAWCGVTERDIAAYFGITVATLASWKNEHPKLEAAILSGQRAQASGRAWDAKARRDAISLLGKPARPLIDSGKATDKAPR